MTILNQRTAQSIVRSGHQGGVDSGSINPLFVDEYASEVDKTIVKKSFMRQYIPMKQIRGTDTLTNHRMGGAQLQKVTRGQRPVDHAPTFDNISIKVDTLILARTNTALIDDFISSLDVRKEVGEEHGKKIGTFTDEAFLVQGIKAAQVTVVVPVKNANDEVTGQEEKGGWKDRIVSGDGSPTGRTGYAKRTAPIGFNGATTVQLGSANDENDPVALELAIQDMCQGIQEKDVDLDGAVILLRPAQYYVLLKNDKLISSEFSTGNGNYAKGKVLESNGIRIEMTNRFPKQSDVGVTHHLSNAGNNNAYDVSRADANCVAVLLMPKALLGGEAIPLTSKVHYSEVELQWFVDSYLSFAVTPNRAEMAGAIFRSNLASTAEFGNA